MRASKTPRESYTEQVQILTLNTMNGNNRLFGGALMGWIDIVAVVVARRHSNRNVTTAAVDRLEFKGSAKANNLIVLSGKMIYAGRTSMQVCVKSFVEEQDGSRLLINRAYLTLVALDENEAPCEVPALIPETEEEKLEYAAAELRAREYKLNRSQERI